MTCVIRLATGSHYGIINQPEQDTSLFYFPSPIIYPACTRELVGLVHKAPFYTGTVCQSLMSSQGTHYATISLHLDTVRGRCPTDPGTHKTLRVIWGSQLDKNGSHGDTFGMSKWQLWLRKSPRQHFDYNLTTLTHQLDEYGCPAKFVYTCQIDKLVTSQWRVKSKGLSDWLPKRLPKVVHLTILTRQNFVILTGFWLISGAQCFVRTCAPGCIDLEKLVVTDSWDISLRSTPLKP